MSPLDENAASRLHVTTVGREMSTLISGIDGVLGVLEASRLDTRERGTVERLRVFVDGLLVKVEDLFEVAGQTTSSSCSPGEVAQAISRDWEALVWAVEDQEHDAVMSRLHTLEGSLGKTGHAMTASHCRALERHLLMHGFEGLSQVLYEFHLRVQTTLDTCRSTGTPAGA